MCIELSAIVRVRARVLCDGRLLAGLLGPRSHGDAARVRRPEQASHKREHLLQVFDLFNQLFLLIV